MAFDYQKALSDGVSEDEIINYLTKTRKFDVQSAVNDGHSKSEIISYLANTKPLSTSSQQASAPKNYSLPEVAVNAVVNTPKSLKSFVTGIYDSVRHPIKTAGAIADIGAGVMDKLADNTVNKIPGLLPKGSIDPNSTLGSVAKGFSDRKSEQTVDAVSKFFVDRYGGYENLKRTVAEDPVGFLADVSTLFSGGELAATKLGTLAETANMTKAASVANKVAKVSGVAAKATDPITVLTKPVELAAKGTTRAALESLGVSTGSGYGATSEALKAKPGFWQALTGKENVLNIYDEALDNLRSIKDQRRANYQDQLAKIPKNQPQTVTELSARFDPINKQLNKSLENLKIDTTKRNVITDESGKLRLQNSAFDNSPIRNDATAVNQIKTIYEDWNNWNDFSIQGLDAFKQGLTYNANSPARAFVKQIESATKSVLDAFPEYKKMTGDYHQLSETIREIEQNLSLGEKAATDTGIRKLNSMLRQNTEYRQMLVNDLEKYGGKEITSKIAGAGMNDWIPKGLQKLAAEGSIGAAAIFQNPWLLTALPFTSPKLVGGMLYGLGMAKNKVSEVVDYLRKTRIKAATKAESYVKAKYPNQPIKKVKDIKEASRIEQYFNELGLGEIAAKELTEYIKTGTLSDKLKYLYEIGNISRQSEKQSPNNQ